MSSMIRNIASCVYAKCPPYSEANAFIHHSSTASLIARCHSAADQFALHGRNSTSLDSCTLHAVLTGEAEADIQGCWLNMKTLFYVAVQFQPKSSADAAEYSLFATELFIACINSLRLQLICRVSRRDWWWHTFKTQGALQDPVTSSPDNHDATSPLFFPPPFPFRTSPFHGGSGITPRKILELRCLQVSFRAF